MWVCYRSAVSNWKFLESKISQIHRNTGFRYKCMASVMTLAALLYGCLNSKQRARDGRTEKERLGVFDGFFSFFFCFIFLCSNWKLELVSLEALVCDIRNHGMVNGSQEVQQVIIIEHLISRERERSLERDPKRKRGSGAEKGVKGREMVGKVIRQEGII